MTRQINRVCAYLSHWVPWRIVYCAELARKFHEENFGYDRARGVVVDNGVEGAFVPAGTQLAVAYNYSRIFVTARVDETDIDAVAPGQRVDISVDAYPDATITGTVSEIQGGAAGVFSLFPQSNTSGNFQKVTQVIPVKIAISNPDNVALVPGMNVYVKIHKN